MKFKQFLWATIPLFLSAHAIAADIYWKNDATYGTWITHLRWVGDQVPLDGDNVFLIQNDDINRTVSYGDIRTSSSGHGLYPDFIGNLSIDATGTGSMTLFHHITGSLIADTGYIGVDGAGNILHESGSFSGSSTSQTFNNLWLGLNEGSSGTYNINNLAWGTTTLAVNNGLVVGISGEGEFNQENAGVTVDGVLVLGRFATGNGTYTMMGDSTLQANEIWVGADGVGEFNQLAGTNVVANDLVLGGLNGSGTYRLFNDGINFVRLDVGGNIVSGPGSSHLVIDAERRDINVTGGLIDVDKLTFSSMSGIESSFPTHGININVDDAVIGLSGAADFTHGGGIFNIGNNMSMATNLGSTSTYTMNSGELNVSGSILGGDGNSTFNYNGGVVNIGGNIAVDNFVIANKYGISSFTLSNGNDISSSIFIVGDEGNGEMIQDGGNVIATSLIMGKEVHPADPRLGISRAQGEGSYQLKSGSLSVNDASIGVEGSGVFTQSGGTFLVADVLGISAGSALNIEGGMFSANAMYLGSFRRAGSGVVEQTGGDMNVSSLNLGESTHSGGRYTLDSGSINAQDVLLGGTGGGGFFQNGGNHTIAGTLTIGDERVFFNNPFGPDELLVGRGRYALTNGNLNVNDVIVGVSGEGTFDQNGGEHIVNGVMTIAKNDDGEGVYNLNGGVLDANHIIATGPNSQFNFNGGILAVDTFDGNLENIGGVLSPGNSPGLTTINGDYMQTVDAILDIEIGGLIPGIEHDVLEVTGSANLGGTLDVDWFDLGGDLFTASAGDSFNILSAETILGEFDFLTLAILGDGLGWDVSYIFDDFGTDFVRLNVISAPAVPVPAAIWLFGTGILGLIGFSKRRKTA